MEFRRLCYRTGVASTLALIATLLVWIWGGPEPEGIAKLAGSLLALSLGSFLILAASRAFHGKE